MARHDLRFSDLPMLHYYFTITILAAAHFVFSFFRIYGCLSSGNDYDCKYDPDSPAMIASRAAGKPDFVSVLGSTTFISVTTDLFLFVNVLIWGIPVFALAYYVGRCCGVHRNSVGVVFWIAAWTFAFLSFPILSMIREPSNLGHRSWIVYLSDTYPFAMIGLFCGIVYCALAFLHRDKTAES
jgi:hypothetical protein